MSSNGKWMGLAIVAPTILAIGAFSLFLVFNQERSKTRATIVKGELEKVEMAKEQYALENRKDGKVVPRWSDLVPYIIKTDAKLAERGGKDFVGKNFIIGAIEDPVWVNPATMNRLQAGVEKSSFWRPNKPWIVQVTPLHEAVSKGDFRVVTELLKQDVPLEARNELLETPLHCAARTGHEPVVKLLIERGAKINAKGWMNRTPLHYAAGEGHRGAVEFLIARGSEVNARDISNDTPLSYAFMSGKNEIVELLKKHGGK
jgi:hypothetical protein